MQSQALVPGPDDAPGAEGDPAGAASVRLNLLNSQVRGPAENPKHMLWFASVWYSCQVIAAAVILSRSGLGSCDKPLGLWSLLYSIRSVCALAVGWVCYNEASLVQAGHRNVFRFAKRLEQPFHVGGFVWFVIGNIWIMQTETCKEENPEVYDLTFSLLVLNYIVIFLPCIFVMMLIPVICCCLPCLLRVLGRVRNSERGASASDLRKIKTKQFQAGMFEEADCRCVICLGDYELGDTLRELPCGGKHHFHQSCVDDWLKLNATCPNCRENVVTATQAAAAEGGSSVLPADSPV